MTLSKRREVQGRRSTAKAVSNKGCPISIRDGVMTVECRSCPGKRDLQDINCLRAVLRAISVNMAPNEIQLSGEWEISYSGKCVEALCRLASILVLCEELSNSPGAFSKCKGCQLSSGVLYGSVSTQFPTLPNEKHLDSKIPRRSKSPERCARCLREARSNIAQIRFSLEELSREFHESPSIIEGWQDEA